MSDRLFINPHLTVQFADGLIWIHVADTNQTISCEDPEILQTLAGFRSGGDIDAVRAAASTVEQADHHLAELRRIGAFTSIDETPPDASPRDLIERFLSPAAESIDSLAGSLAAIGPAVGEAIRVQTGASLQTRLQALMAGLTGLHQIVGARVPGWIDKQLDALQLPADGLALHLGAGSAAVEGWVNIDAWPAQLAMDLRWGLPFNDDSADYVFLSHLLEHLYYPAEAQFLLREIHRVLRPGGRVRIIVPDIEACITAYVERDEKFFAGRHECWPDWKMATRMESFLGFAGIGRFPGAFGDAHKWGYDHETVFHLLETTGFHAITKSEYQQSADPRLRIDDVSEWAGAHSGQRHYSLFVEALR